MTVDLRLTANSFDLFDTLVARRAIAPQRVFEEIGRSLGASGFATARVAAEQALMQRGQGFDLHGIYREIVARGQCSPEAAESLKAAEIDAEFDHAVPIVENLARVREFDLVVSDMYLPADVLRRLLQHVGLRVFVHLFVSNAGKHFGTIWPQLGERWLIQRHLGDDLHADVAGPRAHGIATEHFAGAQPSQAEQLLLQHGQFELAGISRALRLCNPYPASSSEAQLWLLYAQLNLPLLCLAASAVRHTQLSHGRRKLLFSARDAYFLSELFSLLYPAVPADYLHVSRQTLWQYRDDVDVLLDRLGAAEALVVDLASTGHSWYRFCEAKTRAIDFFSVIHIDHHQPILTTLDELAASRYLRFSSLIRNSELGDYSNAIEVLNTALHGSTLALTSCGGWVVPVMGSEHELPPHLLDALVAAHAAAMALVRRGRIRLLEELPSRPPAPLLQTLLRTISVQPLLIELGKKFI